MKDGRTKRKVAPLQKKWGKIFCIVEVFLKLPETIRNEESVFPYPEAPSRTMSRNPLP